MTLTDGERARLRGLWRTLARGSHLGAVETITDATPACLDWASPIEAKGGAFALFALARLAHAFSRGTAAERTRMRPALCLLGELAGDVLDASDPDHAEPPPQGRLPYADG